MLQTIYNEPPVPAAVSNVDGCLLLVPLRTKTTTRPANLDPDPRTQPESGSEILLQTIYYEPPPPVPATVSNVDGCLLLVPGKNPDHYPSLPQVGDGLRYSLLEKI
jgi:hypothetical protein